ncbi:MAG: hypothetical protein AAGU12_13795 [Clostridiales bacterium]
MNILGMALTMAYSSIKIAFVPIPDKPGYEKEISMKIKAVFFINMLLVFMLLFTACGGTGSSGESGSGSVGSGGVIADSENRGEREQPNLVDNGDSVSLTFPAEMFEGVELSQEFKEVNHYIEAIKNPDGRVTITMTKERQQEFLTSIKDTVDYNIEYFKSELDYLKEIKYAEDFTAMEIYVAGNTDKDTLRELPYFFSLPFEQYQQMLGQEPEVAIAVIDEKNGEVLLRMDFPEAEQESK